MQLEVTFFSADLSPERMMKSEQLSEALGAAVVTFQCIFLNLPSKDRLFSPGLKLLFSCTLHIFYKKLVFNWGV